MKHELSPELLQRLQEIISYGFENAARGFAGMVGEKLSVIQPVVRAVPLQEIPILLGGAENDAVGIYLRIEGDMIGQIMLIIPIEKAFSIVDMLMEQAEGTTQKLGQMERSALAEVGNLTGCFFLNAVAEITKYEMRPSPPAVMVDMVGAMLDVIIATMGSIGDEVLMFQATFVFAERETRTDFWIVPDPNTLDKLIAAGKK